MKAPGKKLLQVVGIILVVFGAFGLLGTAMNFFVASSMTSEMEEILASTGYSAQDVMAGAVWGLISSVIWLIAGIIGIKNCNKTGKAKICVILGGLMLVEILAEAVYSLAGGQFAIVGTVINLILPLLYFWGALKNFQADTKTVPASPVDGVADILEVSSDKMRQTSQEEDEDQ